MKTYDIKGLDCANCAAKIEAAIKAMPEVEDATLSFATSKLRVSFREGEDTARTYLNMVRLIGSIEEGVTLLEQGRMQEESKARRKLLLTPSNLVMLAGVLVFIAAVVLQFAFGEGGHAHSEIEFVWNHWAEGMTGTRLASTLLYYAAFFMCGHRVLYVFVKRLLQGKFMDENFLMTIVGIGAFILGENLEAVAILIFYQVGELCQQLAVERSRSAIRNLVSMNAKSVNKYIDDKNIAEVDAETVQPGDRLIIRRGEKVALDGLVHEGQTSLDTSALTGESMPVRVGEGDQVFSGSINMENVFTESVQKQYSDSTISRILAMVEDATQKKAKSEQFITKFSKIYTPSVVALAFLVALIGGLVTGNATQWIYTGLIMLVISCPCALVISIPMSFFGGVGAAGKRGILLKGSNYLEALGSVDTIVFDKTGTLTNGTFEVTSLIPDGVSEAELLEKAAYAESMTTHPLARSIVKRYAGEINADRISDYEEYGGHGISARVDGRKVICGNAKLLRDNRVEVKAPDELGTVIYIAEEDRYLGCIVLADTVKADAAEAIADLKELGVKRTVMLTGDKSAVAEKVSAELGIDESHAELLPEDKLKILDGLIEENNAKGRKKGSIAFVGEGINDVPALTRADVGISMGALGSDAAMEVANVILMTDEMNKLPMSIRLARKTRQIVVVNIVFSLLTKIVIMLLSFILQAMNIMIPNFILIAEFADVGVALIAILYAMTILRYNPTKKQKHKHAHA